MEPTARVSSCENAKERARRGSSRTLDGWPKNGLEPRMARPSDPGRRNELLQAAVEFIRAAARIPGVRSISVLGSITTDREKPKDIDLLVVIADDTDLARLATHARRLQGMAQQVNCGADVFLADVQGAYLGRTCHWKDCRPGIRAACDALHCGRRPHLHDDFHDVRLSKDTIERPPVTVWPQVVRRCTLPSDVERALKLLDTPSNQALEPSAR
jgi:predicted nucleotidyltransferase